MILYKKDCETVYKFKYDLYKAKMNGFKFNWIVIFREN